MANNDRLEREIEEILGKIEQFPDAESRAKRTRRRNTNRITSRLSEVQRGIARRMGTISIGQMMLASFLLILFAFFFRGRGLPPTVASWLLLAGVILFVSAFAVSIFGPRSRGGSGTVEQRWRGRTIQYQTGSSFSSRIRRWWSSRTNRR
jgi:hypothetical protein